ncbi:MAG: substrate-binding domain-containing protein [Alphaproteobacteria bacterium]|nr:substrate-binding domain-containing protein [Alphaproteobacteria bacterium]
MSKCFYAAAMVVVLMIVGASSADASSRQQIRVVGSSTVYPFVTSAAEQFGQAGEFRTPIVEAMGTGGGIKLFCEGIGTDKVDMANASRKMTDSERQQCQKNGVTDIVELPIGYDGIILVNQKGARLLDLSKEQIFRALARELPDAQGVLKPNHYQRWSEIDKTLPDVPIEVYGPPPTSGTRDAFVELVMEKGCAALPVFAKLFPDEKTRKKTCHLIREDGRYIESGEDDNIIVQKLTSNSGALGILGYGYYEENTSKVQAARINGVLPNFDSIEDGSYQVSRSLYVYIKSQHVGVVPGIAEFAREMISEHASGADGYMTAIGLLPLSTEQRSVARAAVDSLKKVR